MSRPRPTALLDTNVVVRYLVGDPPEMTVVAAARIESDTDCVLSEVVVAETAYVMDRVYGLNRDDIVGALSALIQRENVRLLNLSKILALEALALCAGSRRVAFADALSWAQARHSGISRVLTFDRKFPPDSIDLKILF